MWGTSEVKVESDTRPDWRDNHGPSCTELCKLSEKFGFHFKCKEKTLGIFKQESVLYLKKVSLASVGRMACGRSRGEGERCARRLLHSLGEGLMVEWREVVRFIICLFGDRVNGACL